MKGKIVNLCMGGMNILFGLLILVYTIYIPQEILELTVQELSVTKIIRNAIYIILVLLIGIDLFEYRHNQDNSRMKTGYLLGIFAISFIFIKEPLIASFPIVSGIIIIVQTLKDNSVNMDSTTAISFIGLIMVSIVILIGVSFFYEIIAQTIKNKENKDNQEYTTDYFKYITELEITDVYINIKKDGKYGYINPKGEIVIGFIYDYASPFVTITAFNKDFQIALVCEGKTSYIILKNQRKVMSYRAESANDNYEAKMQELQDIYTNTLGQGGTMQTEIEKKTDQMQKAVCYEELSDKYTYRYDYNDQYDILITQSNLGLGDKYELAKKDNLNIRMNLDCSNLDYDEDNVYLYSNGNIPFFDVSSKEQGWFTGYGKKNSMTGKAQILDFIDDKILIRNYNNDTIYFIDAQGNILSDVYKDIYLMQNQYIVKNSEHKYMVINKEFQKILEPEFDVIDPYLTQYGIYICANTNEAIDFNDYSFAKMNWKLLNEKGETILDGIEQIYGNYYQISNDKTIPYVTRYEQFLKNLKDIEFHFVGDKFYEAYTD